eukprot:1039406-Rhodomonas_salina.1
MLDSMKWERSTMLSAESKDYNDIHKMQVVDQDELESLQDNMAGQISRTIERQSVKALYVAF